MHTCPRQATYFKQPLVLYAAKKGKQWQPAAFTSLLHQNTPQTPACPQSVVPDAQCLFLSTSINAAAAANEMAGQGYLGIANTVKLLPRHSLRTLLSPCTSACLPLTIIHPESGNCCHPTYQKT